MAALNLTPGYPFAGSFFSAKQETPAKSTDANGAMANTMADTMALPFRHSSPSAIVLYLNGQMETFCVHAHKVLIRPNTDREKAQLLCYYRELQGLVKVMERTLHAHSYSP